MGERLLLSLTPSDRALEQAILALKKGAHILKYGRRGKPKLCPFRLSTDERTLMWFSGKVEKQLELSSVTNIIRGHGTRKLLPERESHSFSIIYLTNQAHCSLDLICKDKIQADLWFLGLKALISRCQDSGNVENGSGTQSWINSPTSFIRRKYNLGFAKETTRISQVRSICGSPIPSLSERCFSDGISFSSDSLYSRSSLSSVHNSTDGLVPSSTSGKHEEAKQTPKMVSRHVEPALCPKMQKTKPSDVFVWGEGVENGVLRHRKIQTISREPSSMAAVCAHKSITREQSACCGCNSEFGFIKKKHNCYNCGLLFCSICSSNKTKNACLAPDNTKSFRVCDSCYLILSGQISRIQNLTPRPLLIKTSSDDTRHKNQMGSGLDLDLESRSVLMSRAPRWGQVSSPASFRKHCKEESSLKNVNVDSNQQKPCQLNIEKGKGAKDAIKAFTARLQLMSPRALMRKKSKSRVDTPKTSSNHLTPSAAYVSCPVEASLCNTTLVPTTRSTNVGPLDEAVFEEQNNVKQKHEWMEQYKPGVYITFITLPTGQKGIKRVRFSRKVFREREAERWWIDNQQQVYDYYNVDGYINSF